MIFFFIHTDATPHSPPKQSAESGGLELIPLLNASSRKERLESLSSRRSRGHKRQPEVTSASVIILRLCLRPWGQVADARTPLLKFKIKREILVIKNSRLGKNYLVISDIVVKLLA